MIRIAALLASPEFYWILIYVLFLLLKKIYGAPSSGFNVWCESMGYVVPFLLIPACFYIILLPFSIKKLLLFRLIMASILGSHYVLNKSVESHTEQNSGTGTIYLMGMLFSLIVIAVLCGLIFFKNLAP